MESTENTTVLEGSRKLFEYHCWESHDSQDAQLWYRSHQQVTVGEFVGEPMALKMSFEERVEAALPLVHKITFADGFKSCACEDELLDNESEYDRPDPPQQRHQGVKCN